MDGARKCIMANEGFLSAYVMLYSFRASSGEVEVGEGHRKKA
jgi:hypothetical protein